jgi:PAP2 superfamily.
MKKKTIVISSLIALWLFLMAILVDITEDVLNSEPIINFDKYFAGIFLSMRTALGTNIFSVLTHLGNWQFVVPVFLIILVLLYKKYHSFVWPFIFTVCSAELVTFIGKLLIQRIRPDGGAIVMLDFSFPSGHSTIAVTMYGFLAYLLICQLKEKTAKVAVILGAIFIILLIGFSRLYLGVHYVSDILAGYLVGALALITGISLREFKILK